MIDDKINNGVWNKLYSKELLQRSTIDGELFPEGKNFEDVAVMYRIVDKAKSVAMISEVLYHYRMRPGSITKTYTAKNFIDYTDSMLSRYYFFKNEYPELYEEKKRNYCSTQHVVFSGFGAGGMAARQRRNGSIATESVNYWLLRRTTYHY